MSIKSRMPNHSSGKFASVTERGDAGETPEREEGDTILMTNNLVTTREGRCWRNTCMLKVCERYHVMLCTSKYDI